MSPTAIINAAFILVHKHFTQMFPHPRAKKSHCSFKVFDVWSLYQAEKVNCFSVCPFERPPEAVQDIKSRHVKSHYVPSWLIKDFQPSNTHQAQYYTATSADCKRTHNGLCNFLSWVTEFSYNCQLLPQAKYWNPSVNEVEGTITDKKGKVIHRLFGKWHEAVYCGDPPSATCIWRASITKYCNDIAQKNHFRMRVPNTNALNVICVLCRCYASGPRAVLWFYQVGYWAERAGPILETTATTHRHQIPCGPEVQFSLIG